MRDKINNLSEENYNIEEDTLKDKYLTFFTDNQLFGIPIADVVQIVGVQEITPVPDFPNYAKGIINLRGTIIPIIDVRLRLHKEEIGYTERTCTIVTNINDVSIGFIVDAVNEVTNIEKSSISQPPKMGKDYVNTYITGVAKLGNKVVLLLNTQKMLSESELELITNIQ
ncbi:purine-binding chemotaxis protein CheW [Sedimentibacter acidaminivorans]|uniref:Chemotaxis protein CheW n=1 Tax=Sedimentibacter acidaminivorans TaxID=913099 RepID=A0ABS4GDJ6_9FIRM|nr:chemotaxis protein CheW [Sedimentibacter acidaminivorans]MBP1925768.1 purine-binding chemotaxis protein CheW [Sedimentibacter acidaminivorans]